MFPSDHDNLQTPFCPHKFFPQNFYSFSTVTLPVLKFVKNMSLLKKKFNIEIYELTSDI